VRQVKRKKIEVLKLYCSYNNIFLTATDRFFRTYFGVSVGQTKVTGRKKKTKPIAIQRTSSLLARRLHLHGVTSVQLHFSNRYRISKIYYSVLKGLYSKNIGINQIFLNYRRRHGYGVKLRKPRRV